MNFLMMRRKIKVGGSSISRIMVRSFSFLNSNSIKCRPLFNFIGPKLNKKQFTITTAHSITTGNSSDLKSTIENNLTKAEEAEVSNKLPLAEEYIYKNIQLLEKLIKDSPDINYQCYYSVNLFNLAYIKTKAGNVKKDAEENLNKSLKIYKERLKENLDKLDLHLRQDLAKAQTILKNYEEAIFIYESYNQAEGGDNLIKINSFINIADCYQKLNEKEKVRESLEKYRELMEKYAAKDKHFYLELARSYESLAQDYLIENKYLKAEEMLIKSSEYYVKFSLQAKDNILSCVNLMLKANIYEAKEKYKEAIEVCEKYIQIVTSFDEKENTTGSINNINHGVPSSQHVFPYKDRIFHLLLSYYIMASCYYNLGDKIEAKNFYILAHKELNKYMDKGVFEDGVYKNMIFDMKYKIALGNKHTGNFSESVVDFDYVISNLINAPDVNLDLLLNSMFKKAGVLFTMKDWGKSKQSIYDILNFVSKKEIRLKEEKMKEIYKMLVTIEENVSNNTENK